MSAENSTGSVARLSLSERARQGLLAGEPELSLQEILALEHPTDPQARRALGAAIRAAFKYGDLIPQKRQQQREVRRKVSPWFHPAGTWTLGAGDPPSRLVTDVSVVVSWWIEKEPYRYWRAQCPATLLSALSQIQKWLGATPAVETSLPEPSLPEPPASFTKLEKRQRNDAMSNAIRAAIAVLSPSGEPLPQPKALFDYLATRDGTKTIVDSSKEQLTWYTAETGIKKTTTVADLKKRLDRWKD